MSQEHGHVERQVVDVVLDHEVLCVEDVGVAETFPELVPELVKRGVVLICAALLQREVRNNRWTGASSQRTYRRFFS